MEDNRTHGADSAINDELPRNMTHEADERVIDPARHEHESNSDRPTGGTRMFYEDVPADLANSPHGDVPLEYTLQNFNALVAANTAMESVISEFAQKEALWREMVDNLTASVEDLRAAAGSAQKVMGEQRLAVGRLTEEAKTLTADLDFAREERDELQRKLDRTHGYLDRVLDEEDGYRAPETRTVPASKPPVGPNLEDIPRAARRNQRGDMDMFARNATIRSMDEMGRPRRY